MVEQQLAECNGQSEYALYVKALIKRQHGQILESLHLFQSATSLNPHSAANLKQVGRSLYLLGKHRSAIDVYAEAKKLAKEDWEIWHNEGLCYMYLKEYERAIDAFNQANSIQRHDSTFMQIGKVYTLQEDYQSAIDVYQEALEFSPENAEVSSAVASRVLSRRTHEGVASADSDDHRAALPAARRELQGFRLSGQLPHTRSQECQDDPGGRLDHPGPPGHGRSAHQVPRRGCANAELGAAMEQHWHVLLRQAALRGRNSLLEESAVRNPTRAVAPGYGTGRVR